MGGFCEHVLFLARSVAFPIHFHYKHAIEKGTRLRLETSLPSITGLCMARSGQDSSHQSINYAMVWSATRSGTSAKQEPTKQEDRETTATRRTMKQARNDWMLELVHVLCNLIGLRSEKHSLGEKHFRHTE